MRRRRSLQDIRRRHRPDSRPEYASHIVGPPDGLLVRAGRGMLNHRIRYGAYFPYSHRTVWHTECDKCFSSGRSRAELVPVADVDFVCSHCEQVAADNDLPPFPLLPESGCEAWGGLRFYPKSRRSLVTR